MNDPGRRPATPPPPGRKRGAESIGDLLAGFLATTAAGREVARETLEAGWREAVGPEVAADTRVGGLRDGVLHVGVASAALLQELATFYKASIVASLRRKGPPFAGLRDVVFRQQR